MVWFLVIMVAALPVVGGFVLRIILLPSAALVEPQCENHFL
jgi:hypothetical protein